VPGLLLTVPYTAVQFVALQQVKDAAARLGWASRDGPWSSAISLGSGAVAGAAATVASYPFDLLRTTLAAQGEPKVRHVPRAPASAAAATAAQPARAEGQFKPDARPREAQLLPIPPRTLSPTPTPIPQVYRSMMDAARGIYREQGVAGLYRGLGVTLVEIVPYAALQFGLYDALSAAWTNARVRGRQPRRRLGRTAWGGAVGGCLSAAMGATEACRAGAHGALTPAVSIKSGCSGGERARRRQRQGRRQGRRRKRPAAARQAAGLYVRPAGGAGGQARVPPAGRRQKALPGRPGAGGRRGAGARVAPPGRLRGRGGWSARRFPLSQARASQPLPTCRPSATPAQVAGLPRSLRYGARVEGRLAARPLLSCLAEIYAKEGVAGLWKGSVPSIVKAAPAAAITFTAYEAISAWLYAAAAAAAEDRRAAEEAAAAAAARQQQKAPRQPRRPGGE
jgi:hypothetical protein